MQVNEGPEHLVRFPVISEDVIQSLGQTWQVVAAPILGYLFAGNALYLLDRVETVGRKE